MAYNATNPNGQAASAASAPVVIANDQTTIKTKLSNDIPNATGSITTATTTITTVALSDVGSATVGISGTYAGVTVVFEGSLDGTNWLGVPAQPLGSVTPAPVVSAALTNNTAYVWNISPLLGIQYVRVRATAWTSGSASVIISPSAQFTQPIVNVGSGSVGVNNDATVSGSLSSANLSMTTNALVGAATATIQVVGTSWSASSGIVPSASVDGVNFVNLTGATTLLNVASGVYSAVIGSATAGIWQMDVSSYNYLKLTASGTVGATAAAVTIKVSSAASMIGLDAPLPTGSNLIGSVSATLATGSNTFGYTGLTPLVGAAGLTAFSNQALTNTAVSVKGSAARMFEYDFYNPNSSGVWVQLFNTTTVTLGTTVPTRTIYVPPTSGRDWTSPYSIAWSTALYIACTTTNTGSTAPTSAIQAYIGYV